MRTQRKFLAWMMTFFLLASVIPTAALAAEPEDENGKVPPVYAGSEADESCPAEEHAEGCPLYVAPEEETEDSVEDEPDDMTNDVNELTIEEQLAALIAALPAPDEIDPEDEEQVEEVNGQISEIYAFAGENGLEIADNEIINAVIAALYPAEVVDDDTPAGTMVSTADDLNDAITNASGTADTPTVITISCDFEIKTAISIASGKHIVIDGGGHTISRSDSSQNVQSESKGLTLAQHVMFYIEGDVVIKNLTIDANGDGTHSLRGVVVNNGSLDLYDCKITGAYTEVSAGGGLAVVGGTANLYSGEISGNTAKSGAGALCDRGGTFNMYDGTISYNKGLGKGAHAVCGYSNSKLNLYGGEISNNKNAEPVSGALYKLPSDRNDTYTISGDLNIDNSNDRSIYVASGNSDYLAYADNIIWTKPAESAVVLTSPLKNDLYFYSWLAQDNPFMTRRTLLIGTENYQLSQDDLDKVHLFIQKNDEESVTDITSDANYIKLVLDNRIEFFKKVTITYHANYEDNNDTTTQDVGYGAKTVLASNPFQREDYAFIGWNTNADGTGTSYNDEQELKEATSLTANIDLYAKWEVCTHTWKDATCTEPKTCSICGKTDGDALGHSYQEVVTAPTCTEKGYTTHTCSRCDDSYVDTYVSAAGHKFGEWETVTLPNCTDKGSEQRVCSACGYPETRDVAAAGHDWESEFTIDKAAACTEDGSKSIHCKNCGAVKDSAVIPATGHNWDDGVVTKEPTYSETGIRTYTCKNCGETKTEEIAKLTRPSGGSSSGTPSYTVSVDSGRNGSVSVSPKSASKGTTVTITVKPDSGYELDDLAVTDKNGNAVKLTKKSGTKYTFTMPAGKVTVEATFVKIEEAPQQTFTDVPDGYWAEDAIAWAYENGYMNGNTAVTFNPEGTVSRQQLWMILARLSGYNPAAMAEAKNWAVDNGISDGTVPGGPVSRQQLVTILYRYAVRMGYQTDRTADLTAYPDHASVAAYAKDAMSWSVANSIVGGTTQGTLNPAGTATRAQFAVILSRFCENIVG